MTFRNTDIESEKQFNTHADKYAVSEVHRLGASLPVLLEYAAPQPTDHALDIATGTGNTALNLAPYVAQVTGIDLAQNMLNHAQARAAAEGHTNAHFTQGDAERLPFADASFDLLTSRHAPHHFRDLSAFLAESYRVLRLGGRLVVADQISPSAELQPWLDRYQQTRDPSHFAQRTVMEWQQLAQAAGFVWARQTLVPYRLEFVWWTQQSGCTPSTVAQLREQVAALSPEQQQEIGAELDTAGQLVAHVDQMMVVRLEKQA